MSWETLGNWVAEDAVIVGLRVAGILVGAVVLSALLRRAVRRVEKRISTGDAEARTVQRTRTLTRVITSAGIVTIWVLAVLMMLGVIPGFNLGPLLAGLGIGGLAIGFGAQSLVRDVVSGFFILLEDQYGIGDIIEVNKTTSGTVELLTLRLTGLRDVDGTVHYFSNGFITQVSNRSKDWAAVLIDVRVAYDADISKVRKLLEKIATDFKKDTKLGPELLAVPAVLGVEALEDKDVVLRMSAQVKPSSRVEVARRLREKIIAAFDRAKIDIRAT